jgi:hypothetical protein
MRTAAGVAASMGLTVLLSPFCLAATISGTVKGPDGAPFEGAFLEAQNAKTRITVDVCEQQGRLLLPG